jgi:hypothetical protein
MQETDGMYYVIQTRVPQPKVFLTIWFVWRQSVRDSHFDSSESNLKNTKLYILTMQSKAISARSIQL